MHFKHPELLYALFLLIIPILIHLFQLRRFQKVEFTNVKFLKSVKLQTRKSSQLKKWLTLITRMLLLACIIIAFAQPFIPNTEDFNETQETVIYLDNSFSMQAEGKNGSLLNEAIQDIITTLPEDEKLSLFTNNKTFKNTTLKAIKNDLILLSYSTKQLNYDAAYLKGKQLFSEDKNTSKNLVMVSDFQQKNNPLNFEIDSIYKLNLVQPESTLKTNISVDSIYIASKTAETLNINIVLSSQTISDEAVSVSLYNNDVLFAKSAVNINDTAKTTFSIPNEEIINGKIQIEDSGLQYDNTFYFNINSKPKIKVLAINESISNNYLKRIYTDDEFEFESFKLNSLNFNLIPDQNLIVLNELETISNALKSALIAFKNDGGSVLIIPSENINLASYNLFFRDLSIPTYANKISIEKRVTSINYDHPLLKNSFYSKVSNFQYPQTQSFYPFATNQKSVLSFEDGSSFLYGNKQSFIFSSSLNSENSNFKNSPLIVPVLYNIGKQSLKLSKLYYIIGKPNNIAVNTVIGQDDILTLNTDNTSVIPLQKTFSKSVVIETGDFPNKAGILNVKNNEDILQNLSYNYSRTESELNYYDLNSIQNVTITNSLSDTIDTIKSNRNVNALWKWFVIFALAFLLIEMLLLKYLK